MAVCRLLFFFTEDCSVFALIFETLKIFKFTFDKFENFKNIIIISVCVRGSGV